MGVRSVRAITRSALVLVMLVLLAGSAAADTPLQFRTHVDFTFLSPGASALCGFPIFVHIVGDGRATVFYDKSGAIASEVDSSVNQTLTIFAPSTGNSYTWHFAGALIQYYTDGAAIGSTALAIATGVSQRYPDGITAGRTVYEAVVIDYDGGVPIIDFVNLLSESGADLPVSVARARCDAVK